MRLPYQFVIPTTSKSVKFLLACLIRKIIKGGIDPERPVWDLDQRGVEANYLKLLYNKKVDNSFPVSSTKCNFPIGSRLSL